jgi:ribosome maturation protein SDO1
MEIARVSIDAFKPAEQQVDDILKALKSVLPIAMEETKLTVEIPAQYSGRVYGMLKDMGTVGEQEWLSDGSLVVKLTIPAGLRESVYKRLGGLTNGSARITEG